MSENAVPVLHMPERLTAEEGYKDALRGEFFVEYDARSDSGMLMPCKLQIPWRTIKEIYAAAVAHRKRTTE